MATIGRDLRFAVLCSLALLCSVGALDARAAAPHVVIRTATAVPGLAWVDQVNPPGSGPDPLTTFGSTTDGGATWKAARQGEVAGPDPALRWAIGQSTSIFVVGGVIASNDGGASWHTLPSFTAAFAAFLGGGSQDSTVEELLADPVRPGVVYAVVYLSEKEGRTIGVIASTDAGATWTVWHPLLQWYDGRQFARVEVSLLPGRDALLVERVSSAFDSKARDQLIVATASGLRVIARAPAGSWSGDSAVDRSGTRVLVASFKKGWRLSTDGGRHVRALGLAGADAPAFDPSGTGRIFALRHGYLWHTHDDGRHWTRRARLPDSLGIAKGIAIDRSGRLVYLNGSEGVSVSRDAGATFRLQRPFVAPFVDPAGLVVAGDTAIDVTDALSGETLAEQSGGAAFHQVPAKLGFASSPGWFAAAPTGDAVVVVADPGFLIRSADGSWQPTPIPLFANLRGLALDPRGVVYAVYETGDSYPPTTDIAVAAHAPGGAWGPLVQVAQTTEYLTDEAIGTDAAGDVLVAYLADGGVWATVLRAGGPGWSEPVRISGGDVTVRDGLLVAGGGAGTFVVTWDADPQPGSFAGTPRAARVDAAGSWSGPVNVLPLPGPGLAPMRESSLAVDATGYALLVSATATGPQAFVWAPGTSNWISSALAPPASPDRSYGTPALALASDGSATIAFPVASSHAIDLQVATSTAPFSWSEGATTIARLATCPAGDCLAAVRTVAAAAGSSRTVVESATVAGMLTLSRTGTSGPWTVLTGTGRRPGTS